MDELAKRFADLAAQYGPAVVSAALGAAQTEGYSCLVASLIQLIFAVGFLLGAKAIWRRRPPLKDGSFANNDGRAALSVVAGVCVAISCAFLAAAIWTWVDPWTWTAINRPELWLAKKAFHI